MKRITTITVLAVLTALFLMPSDILAYELPDPLVFNNGKSVKTSRQWEKKRRAEVLEVFAQEMYGHVPARPEGMHFERISEETVYGGLGIRKVVRIYLDASDL